MVDVDPELEVRWFADFDDRGDAWDDLAAASGDVFATRTWLGAWWRHFGRDRPLHLAALVEATDPDRVVAIVALYEAAQLPIRTLRFLGHGPSDRLGPICAPADLPRAIAALPAVLDEIRGWGLCIADELADVPSSAPPPGASVLGRAPMHVASLEGVTGDAWFAARSRQLRHQLRRGERELRSRGEVTFRTADDPDRLDRDLDSMLDLHRRHWARRPGGSRAFVGRDAFHRDVARSLLERGWLRLHLLELDGAPVAALHSFWFGGSESHYQGGRDPRFDRCSVGLLLHERAIRAAADAGAHEYRFLRGDEPYKRRLADRVDLTVSLAWANGAAGGVARWLVVQQRRLDLERARWVPAPWAWGTGGTPRWGEP